MKNINKAMEAPIIALYMLLSVVHEESRMRNVSVECNSYGVS